VGFGIAGTGFGVILAIVGRAASTNNVRSRSASRRRRARAVRWWGPVLAEGLLAVMPWQSVFIVFAGIIAASLLLLPLLRSPAPPAARALQESLSQTLGKAFRDPSYTLIFVGFFSCGYQLGFITAHFPAFITEVCGPIDPGSVLTGWGSPRPRHWALSPSR
jgi:hypothetical protein